LVDPIWNLGTILPDSSPIGQILKTLVGYSSAPSLTQVIGYLGYFVILGLVSLMRTKNLAVGETA
jgi:high-affinity Fe2+/Pb2+ permease